MARPIFRGSEDGPMRLREPFFGLATLLEGGQGQLAGFVGVCFRVGPGRGRRRDTEELEEVRLVGERARAELQLREVACARLVPRRSRHDEERTLEAPRFLR